MEKKLIKVRIVKNHPGISYIFPLGFETFYYVRFTEEDKVSKGFATKINGKDVWVEDKIVPKGTFKDIIFIGKDGNEYNSDIFHGFTGNHFTEFVEKI